MIKQIQMLALQCASLNIIARSTADGALSMTFVPTLKEGGDAAMAKPFTLIGTPEELEIGLPQALARIVEQRASLAEQVEATNAVLEMSKKSIAEKGANALKGKVSKAGPKQSVGSAAASDPDDLGDPDDPDEEAPGNAGNAAGPSGGEPLAAAEKTGQATAAPAMKLFE